MFLFFISYVLVNYDILFCFYFVSTFKIFCSEDMRSWKKIVSTLKKNSFLI